MPTKTKTSSSAQAARNKSHAPHDGWKLRTSENGVGFFEVPAFSAFPWLIHGFSTSQGGVSSINGTKALNLGFTEWDTRENVQQNRKLFQSALNANKFVLVSLKQFHSDVVCGFSSAPHEPCNGDASIAMAPNLLLGIQTADCVPILLLDPKKPAIAAVHAGWRGTLQRIVEKTIGRMKMEFKTDPSDLLAAIGPAIGGCCYEVGTEVAAAFHSQFANAPEWFDELRTGDEPNPLQWLNQFPPGHQPPPKNVRLDLRKANRAQLLAAGLRSQNIFENDLCAACRPDLLFSYRKQGGESGRMMSVIGIRAEK
ncbi:MAG: purine-nucleoside/S-methyl-5-thioadenosine phosphorylase / adenosine deaminase [Acidobacteriaceae bacterium]|nr:purine-nucleoside/S-methyl-5-thioadenosine phosphorylase / adenosine deaminase [Acidobacteriaceae bacterium]